MIDTKSLNKLYDLLVKVTNVFTDFYIVKQGYLVSLDIEKPYIIQLDQKDVKLFSDLCGEFFIIHVPDIKNFKKAIKQLLSLNKIRVRPSKEQQDQIEEQLNEVMASADTDDKTIKEVADDLIQQVIKESQDEALYVENYYTILDSSDIEYEKVVNLLKDRINEINSCVNWESFTLSNNITDNTKLVLSLFKDNNYINFQPKDNTENPEIILTKSILPLVTEKNYTDLYYTTKKKDSNLYLIVFDFQFSLFRLYMFHYYIPMKE